MTVSRKDEARYLDKDERALVDSTHHPAITNLADKDLADLKKRVRERRDRARDIASRQRREMRGKARPQGAEAATGNEGSKLKLVVLAQAMKRLNSEAARRQRKGARAEMVEGMRAALKRKRAADGPKRPDSKSAGKGMKAKPREKREQIADPREAGRVSQAVKRGQARRDSK